MKLSRLPGIIGSVPIKYPVGGVAVLLDFDQHVSASNSMKASRGQKHGVARLNFKTVDQFRDGSRSNRLLEFIPRDRFAKSDVQFRAGDCGRDVPKFCFRL